MDCTQFLKLQEKLKNTQSPGEGDGRGIGLKNVQERIHMFYGRRYGMTIDSQAGKGTQVSVLFPMRREC